MYLSPLVLNRPEMLKCLGARGLFFCCLRRNNNWAAKSRSANNRKIYLLAPRVEYQRTLFLFQWTWQVYIQIYLKRKGCIFVYKLDTSIEIKIVFFGTVVFSMKLLLCRGIPLSITISQKRVRTYFWSSMAKTISNRLERQWELMLLSLSPTCLWDR